MLADMNGHSQETRGYGFVAGVLAALLGVAVLTASCGTANSDVEAGVTTGNPSTLTKVRRAIGVDRGSSSKSVTLPVGTVFHLQLANAVASDTSRVQDVINADLMQPVVINGRVIIPEGARVSGLVSEADEGGRVKGRAQVSVDFNALQTGGTRYDMQTSGFSRTADASKGEDAAKIGVGAGVGAAVGALIGGKKGAAEGAAIGGGAGTGVVLATHGKDVRLPSGTDVTTRLTAPLTVRVAN